MKEKIGIISDTHGLLRPEVLEILKDCKYILHAVDVNKDEILDVLRSMGNLYVVRGNNDKDWAENLRTSLSFTIGGVKFFMVHNKKDIAWELGDTQVVIFGHTHLGVPQLPCNVFFVMGAGGHPGGHLRAYSQIFREDDR